MTQVYRVSVFRRRWLLAVGFLGYFAFLSWLATTALFFIGVNTAEGRLDVIQGMFSPWEWDDLDNPSTWALAMLPALVICVSQILFLLPVVRLRPAHGGRAGSLVVSMIVAGGVGAALTFGLALGVVGLMQLLIAHSEGIADPAEATVFESTGIAWLIMLVLTIGSWIVWSISLLQFARRRQGRGVFGRVVGVLLGGTLLEVILVLPVDIMIRRKTDCYCATASFGTLVLSAWALLWLTGPGIVLALTSKRRRLWRETHCEMCGYAKGPTPGTRCPECGHEWQG